MSTFYQSFSFSNMRLPCKGNLPPPSSCHGLATKITEFSRSSNTEISLFLLSFILLYRLATTFYPVLFFFFFLFFASSTRQAAPMSSPSNIISMLYPIWSVDPVRIYTISPACGLLNTLTPSRPAIVKFP